jgi:phosphoribosylamine---glycine ligase
LRQIKRLRGPLMNVLVIGSGGREHALIMALAKSPELTQLWAAPGNPGIANLAQCTPIAADAIPQLLAFAQTHAIDLTVVGPEVPLALGIVDAFEAAGLTIFGPSQAAATLESSKAFAKAVMQAANVPTGGYVHAHTATNALVALAEFTPPYVIKEDGLAAGKGVTIAPTKTEAEAAITAAFAKGMTVVIEAFLHGQELSVLALCDGTRALPLVPAQDFKRALDGDQGPNTGGMGAYAPVPWATDDLLNTVKTRVCQPVLAEMAKRGTPFKGVLYAGLMIDDQQQPHVIEFNARFGDPETQVVLPLLDEDLLPLLLAAAQGNLSPWEKTGVAIKPAQSAVTVVLAAQGYPGTVTHGTPIALPTALPPHTTVCQAGTALTPAGQLVTQGGRVINAVGTGANLNQARQAAYALAQAVEFNGKTYRTDIAEKAAQLTIVATATV